MKAFLRKIKQLLLQLIPETMWMPILCGRMRGMKWIIRSFNPGCWLGSYERKIRCKFEKTIKNGHVVYDIGAHVGYYSLLASKLAGPGGKVFSFEPVPWNLRYLRKHLAINHVTNTTIVEAAVSDRKGTQFFDLGPSSSMGGLSSSGELKVDTISLDEFVLSEKNPAPHYIKMDVEGAETLVLGGGQKMLAEFHPIIFLAAHGYKKRDESRDILISLGYRVETLLSNATTGDYELLAVYP